MGLFLKIVTCVALLGIGLFFSALTAITLRVFIDLFKAGPGAAEEAYRSGDSLSGWWHGRHPNPTSTGIRGRRVKGVGIVMEETGSRDPSWGRDL